MSLKRKSILIFTGLIGAIGLFGLYFVFFGNRPGPGVGFRSAVGVAAQDFEFPALRGGSVKLSRLQGEGGLLKYLDYLVPALSGGNAFYGSFIPKTERSRIRNARGQY